MRDVDPVDDVVSLVEDAVWSSAVAAPDTVDDGGVETDSAGAELAVLVDGVPVSEVAVPSVSESVVSVLPSAALDAASDDSAHAAAGEVITAIPIPNAAARAPTRPM